MADKEDGTTTGETPPTEVEQGPLVSVTFQRNPARKQKYLEAQPQELGITQIGLSLYQMSWMFALSSQRNLHSVIFIFRLPFGIASAVVMIAGSLAIAAKTLHIPTLRACLTMQILAIVSSVFSLILMLAQLEHGLSDCWYERFQRNETTDMQNLCEKLENSYNQLRAGGVLVAMALLAISVTLAAYCCKVVNCCSPGARMPVITVQAPPNPSAPE